MKKRILAAFMAMTMFLLFIAPTSIRADGEPGSPSVIEPESGSIDDWTWELNEEGTLTISGSGTIYWIPCDSGKVRKVVIREGITGVGGEAFADCTALTSVTFPDSLTYIEYDAFSGCNSLTSVTIPDGVTNIGQRAFSGCSSLTSLKLPNRITEIAYRTFQNCNSLSDITIPDSVTTIGEGAFEGTAFYADASNWTDDVLYCGKWLLKARSGITGTCTVKDGTKKIANDAFSFCHELTGLVLPDGVTDIGEFAFYTCDKLESVTIPNSVTTMGANAFGMCDRLTTVTIPTGVTTIADQLFYRCSSLTSVTIPNGVTEIGYDAFWGCSSLTSVTIPNGVTEIEDGTFGECSSLTSVTIPNGVTEIGYGAFKGCSSLAELTIPDSVTSIGSGILEGTAFWRNEKNWQNGVFYYGKWALDAKEDIAGALTIKDGTVYIAPNAFNGCSGVTGVTMPDSVRGVGYEAFSDCSALTTISLSKNMVQMGASAFSGCNSLKEVTIPGSLVCIPYRAFAECSDLTRVTILDGVETIGEQAFCNCLSLQEVSIPDSVTSIALWALSGTGLPWTDDGALYCGKWLIFVTYNYEGTYAVKEGTIGIASYAFYGTRGLTGVTIPNGVKYIGECAFADSGLEDITLPDSVLTIGRRAFEGTLYYRNENNWKDDVLYCGKWLLAAEGTAATYTVKDGTVGIADSAFCYSPKLTGVTIPDSVMSVGKNAFYGTGFYDAKTNWIDGVLYCGKWLIAADKDLIGSYTVKDGTVGIADYAFASCSGLKSASIPKTVKNIGDKAIGYAVSYSAFDSEYAGKTENFTIRCYTGTAGEAYAKAKNISYELIKVSEEALNIITAAKAGDTVSVEAMKGDKISADVMKAAQEKGVSMEIKSNASSAVVWKFAKVTNAVEFNPEVTVGADIPAVKEVLADSTEKAVLPESTKVTQVSFVHEGDLPGEAEVELSLPAGTYEEGSTVYLYYFEPAKKLFDKISSAKCTGGKAVFQMKHCSDYIITNEELPVILTVNGVVTPSKTGDMNKGIYVVFMILGLMTVGAAVLKKRNHAL